MTMAKTHHDNNSPRKAQFGELLIKFLVFQQTSLLPISSSPLPQAQSANAEQESYQKNIFKYENKKLRNR